LKGVHYFPAYEIVTGNFSRGSYFAEDLRSIREEGVKHVMSLFFQHATEGAAPDKPVEPVDEGQREDEEVRALERENEELVQVLCDEELLGATAVTADGG